MLRRAACTLARPAWTAAEGALAASTSGQAATTSSSAAAAAAASWPMLLVRRHAGSSARSTPPRMPAEYERYYGNVTMPVARSVRADGAAVGGTTTQAAAAATAAPSTSAAADARAGAAAASAWMFPWERRQLDGAPGGLRPWEKAYWGLFVGGLAFLLGSRLYRSQAEAAHSPETEAEAAAKVAAQAEAARALLLGKSFVGDDDDDPLEGLTPEEIQALAEKEIGGGVASGADPFDGWSPDEINEWVERNGEGALPPPAR
jgi:hypothetical protein